MSGIKTLGSRIVAAVILGVGFTAGASHAEMIDRQGNWAIERWNDGCSMTAYAPSANLRATIFQPARDLTHFKLIVVAPEWRGLTPGNTYPVTLTAAGHSRDVVANGQSFATDNALVSDLSVDEVNAYGNGVPIRVSYQGGDVLDLPTLPATVGAMMSLAACNGRLRDSFAR